MCVYLKLFKYTGVNFGSILNVSVIFKVIDLNATGQVNTCQTTNFRIPADLFELCN